MAHVHGTKAAAGTVKHMTGAAMLEHGMMAGMVQGAAKAVPGAVSFHNVAKGAAATASTQAGRSVVSKILRHPFVVFSLGVAVGYAVYKYRKEIIESANRAAERGKDFVLQQRENLEDIVAENRESAE
jgi:hypothetical protein